MTLNSWFLGYKIHMTNEVNQYAGKYRSENVIISGAIETILSTLY